MTSDIYHMDTSYRYFSEVERITAFGADLSVIVERKCEMINVNRYVTGFPRILESP